MRVVYISMVKPYKGVPNGGGQTFYYYINQLSKCEDIEVTLISKVLDTESDDIDIENVKFISIRNISVSLRNVGRIFLDVISKINPFNKKGVTLRRSVYTQIENELKRMKEAPDVVILEFTQMVLMIDIVKKYFPNAKIFASEHDVSFLRCRREYENENNFIKKAYKKIIYKTMLKYEIGALEKCDLIMPHNDKDKKLLLEKGIDEEKIFTLVPYYNVLNVERVNKSKDIIFYGAMNRQENYESAIWFIEKVMPLLEKEDIRFVVVGANPVEVLQKLQSDRVVVTGYVDSVIDYFENCLCLVAPLISGAGIKIKILEAMAAGVPVITNSIGIEGIPAINESDYLHCETPNEYADSIRKILQKEIDVEKLSMNSKKIVGKFNLSKSFDAYSAHIRYCFREQK